MSTLDSYFADEATEQLEQLEILLGQPSTPDFRRMLELTSGFRRSAERAGAQTMASVAERLEDAARSILGENVAWSEELRSLSQQTIGDLKLLVRAVNRWGPEEERRVRVAIDRWDGQDLEDDGSVPISSLFHDDQGLHIFPPEDAASTAEESPADEPAEADVPGHRLPSPPPAPISQWPPPGTDRPNIPRPASPAEPPVERMGDRFEQIEPVPGVEDLEDRFDEPGVQESVDAAPADEDEEAISQGGTAEPDQPLGEAAGDVPPGGWLAPPASDADAEPVDGAAVGPADFEDNDTTDPSDTSHADSPSEAGSQEPDVPEESESKAETAPVSNSPHSPHSLDDRERLNRARGWDTGDTPSDSATAGGDGLPLLNGYEGSPLADGTRSEPSGSDDRKIPGRMQALEALEEALALQPLFERHGRGDAIPERPLSDLVDELFDLLRTVQSRSRPE